MIASGLGSKSCIRMEAHVAGCRIVGRCQPWMRVSYETRARRQAIPKYFQSSILRHTPSGSSVDLDFALRAAAARLRRTERKLSQDHSCSTAELTQLKRRATSVADLPQVRRRAARAPYLVAKKPRAAVRGRRSIRYIWVISRSLVSGRKIRPTTKLIAATAIGYQRPE